MDSYEKKQLIYKFIFILTIVVCITVIATACVMYYYMGTEGFPLVFGQRKESYSENQDENIDRITANIKNFRDVIDRYYIGEIDEEKMLDETLKGYINGLGDEYSEYMTQEEWEEFQTSALGNYVGIGIYMTQNKDGNVVVVSPIKDSPAEKAGLKADDIIVEVNGESVLGETTDVVSSKIKGEAGTTVKIKAYRNQEYKEFEVERQEIKIYHVETKMLEDKIGYIQLITFDTGCADEFKKGYEELKGKGAEKLIIDLRHNTGGIVDEALSILDMIVPKDKTLLVTVDSEGNKEYTKSKEDNIIDMDIVVLVDEYSASASEIMVGALKDNQEATIVGTKTYGKGVIQNVYQLSDGSVLKLTVNEYYTPNETKINKIGIDPDVEVELEESTDENSQKDNQLEKAVEILKNK